MDAERQTWERRAAVHAALGDVTRLRIVDQLALTDRSASELGAALDVPSNLLAHHLRTLEDAGLVSRRRSEGDGRRSYLSLHGHDDVVQHVVAGTGRLRASRLVFVCTANTARSHLAAAAWRRVSDIPATSAGTHPGEVIHPGAVAAAERHGLDLPRVPPRAFDDPRPDDLVVTVCDRAHEELDGLDRAHWSIPDPVPLGRRRGFDLAHEALTARVARLATRTEPA